MLDTIKNTAIKTFNNLIQPNGNHLTPIAQLTINGEPFGTQTTQRIISIELTVDVLPCMNAGDSYCG